MVLPDLRRQGLPISAIARRTGRDRETARKYLRQGLAAPASGPRPPRPPRPEPYEGYRRERVEEPVGPRALDPLRFIEGNCPAGGRSPTPSG